MICQQVLRKPTPLRNAASQIYSKSMLHRLGVSQAENSKGYMAECAGFGWGRVNFLHSDWCEAVFWNCAENSVSNTEMCL